MDNRSYRSDIDGLRAVAVVSVVLNHISHTLIPGGFVGVDIFFVISGFLISSQILKEIGNGRFSIADFYKRRINRIIPALLFVVSVSLVAGFFLLSPYDLSLFLSSAFYSLTGVSNIFFWQVYGNYFAGNSEEAIFLHTWSLGVEEQFYVFWPLVLILLSRMQSRYLVPILALMVVFFLGVSEFGVRNFASASYYLLPTRFYELAIGGLLAVIPSRVRSLGAWDWLAGIAGFLLIAGALFGLNKGSAFPGMNAIYPCLGTAILIWLGAGPTSFFSRLLGCKWLVFIGLISYSLYLWHWPIIAYCNYLDISTSGWNGVFIFLTSILVSWLTWRFIELPMRKSGSSKSFFTIIWGRFAAPVLMIAALAMLTSHFGGFPARFNPDVARFEAMALKRPNELRPKCHMPPALYKKDIDDSCRLGAEKPSVDGIIVGDSYANHFSGMLDVIARSEGISLIDYTMDACPPALGFDNQKGGSYAEKCKARNDHIFDMIAANKYKYVILAANWPVSNLVEEAIMRSLSLIQASGATAIVVLSNPTIKNAASCPIRRLMYRHDGSCTVPNPGHEKYWADIMRAYPEVVFIDPNRVMCDMGTCATVIDGTLLYRDDSHLNDDGSRLIGRLFVSRGVLFFQ